MPRAQSMHNSQASRHLRHPAERHSRRRSGLLTLCRESCLINLRRQVISDTPFGHPATTCFRGFLERSDDFSGVPCGSRPEESAVPGFSGAQGTELYCAPSIKDQLLGDARAIHVVQALGSRFCRILAASF